MAADIAELVPETPYIWRAPQRARAHRLICFPHAGAGAAAYADWVRWLPPRTELVAVQLPGRQNRITEQSFTEVGPLVSALAHTLRPVLDPPFAFFGHSCGAALAYEVASELRARGRRGPARLFVSAQPAPDVTGLRQLHDLPEDEFRAEIIRLGGIEPEVADDEYVMSSLVPIVRADFRLWERHRTSFDVPLDCPITVLGGDSDPHAPVETLAGWRKRTNADFGTRIFPGGHFYFLDAIAEVVSFIGGTMLACPADGRIT